MDQIGYLTNETKYAMVVSAAATGPFDVRRVSDNVSVLTGTLAAAFTDTDSGDSIRTADFTSLTTTGSYYLDVAGVGQSYSFDIGPNVFAGTYVMALRSFYGQRCGTAVNMGTVGGVNYTYPICHAASGPTTATDMPSSFHSSSGLGGNIRATPKGWHDAGDYGKYIVNSGITTGEILWTYEFFAPQIGAININIPESGNAVPDILDEARWNLEWMLTMQDSDGGVWHKNTSAGFGGFTLPHLDNAGTRFIIGTGPGAGAAPYKTSCSTADFAAVMAIAGRVYQGVDAAFATNCLNAAQRAWTWVSANPAVTYTQPTGISTGGYGDSTCTDERYWAAAELWRTTGAAQYNTFITGNTPAGTLLSPTQMPGWPNLRYLGYWAYYFSTGGDAGIKGRIQTDTLAAAASIANRTNSLTNGYRVSLMSNQYIWGSNGDVGNYGVYLTVANRMSPNTSFVNAALNNLHYLLGRNTHSRSFVTHVGDNFAMRPHHRPSGSPTYNSGPPWPGLLVGGPCSSTTSCNDGNTSPVTALPANPPAKRWVDHQNSYSTNENAINWQSALVFLLASTVNGAVPTPTHTVGVGTATMTRTSTPTLTRTPTPTSTRTSTNTPLPNTFTPTRTNSATSTASRTSTATNTLAANTATPTRTNSPTLTRTSTHTPLANTSTPTRTNSPTATSTVTRTSTATNTPPVNTATSTRTNSPTASRTSTSTNTPLPNTSTPSRTATPSATPTPSATLSSTNTPFPNTPTSTRTSSATSTRTGTSTQTVVPNTPTSTRTATPSATLTSSPTSTSTATLTFTATVTDTGQPTATSTATRTATSSRTSSPTATQSPTHTATLTFSMTASATSSSTATGTFTRTLTTTPTHSSTPTHTGQPTDTLTPTPSPSWTATLSPSSTRTPSPTGTLTATSTQTGAPTSTSSPSRTATPSATSSPSSTPSRTSTPTATSSITPTATFSPSRTASRTPTLTPTQTTPFTSTPTPSWTNTWTPTLPSTATSTATLTPIPTSTPGWIPGSVPILIQNPVPSGTALVLPQAYTGTSDVTISLYTSAFKLVAVKSFPSVPAGQVLGVELVDNWGEALADGLYYLAVTTKKDRKTTTMILLR